ncbi:MAG: hypothetical protein C5B54_05045 [Acidobacteria bacterium]|nr:MAG: hypothetical protein C5B54_05045 [Acidobacteriota bacterium]
MIIDVQRFVQSERKYWQELEEILRKFEANPDSKPELTQLKRFHYLYERASADLGRITTFASEREIRSYLESLVARAYGEIHETREKQYRFSLRRWFFQTFPRTFRSHIAAFWLAVAITMLGFTFGGIAISVDSEAKSILMPFPGLEMSPHERVKEEEKAKEDRLSGVKATFASQLMTHNTKIGILMLALGMTWGVGTILLLFYNGVILGAVALDYVMDGQTKFLLGWLLPHGVIEIPAILIAGQAGLLLARALIGYGNRATLRTRLRNAAPDLFTLISGVGLLLVWAGTIESFLSQYHEPVIPYIAKILFGLLELLLLSLFLARSGRGEAR